MPTWLWLVSLGILLGSSARAADVTNITSWTTGTSGPSRFTSGTDRLLVFIAGMEGGSNRTINSVTYGGRSMTQVVTTSSGSGPYARIYIFYLLDSQISSASSNNFSVSWSGSTDEVFYAARMYQNVDQSDPIRDSKSAATNSSSPNPIVTSGVSVEDGDMVVAGAFCGDPGSYSWNNSFTEGTDQGGSTSQQSTAQRSISFDGTAAASATNNGPNRQVIVAAALKNNTPAVPKTYYVRADGDDSNSGTSSTSGGAWRTIQKALSSSVVKASDTIHVRSGTYNERVYPTRDGTSLLPIRILADTNGAIFGGSGGPVIVQAPTDQAALELNNDDYLEFQYFTFRGSNSTNTVYVNDSAGIQLNQCEITLGGQGINLQGSGSSLTIINGLIHHTSDDAIHIYNGAATILNTTIADCGQDGIEQDAGSSTIVNSIIANNGYDGLDRNGGTMSHSYNLIYGNNGNFEGTSSATGEISQNPNFTNTAAGNYRPQGGSPAINAGTDLSGTVDSDLDRFDRPIGASWDLGCYEYTLLGRWAFDEGSGGTAADSSGNDYHGTLKGSANWEAVRCASGVKLNGSTDWIDLGNINLGTKAYTMAAWFKSSATVQQTVFAATANGTNNHVFFARLTAAGQIQFVHRSPAASSGGTTLSSTDTYNDGLWHHVAVVKSTSDMRLYVDGGLVDFVSNSTSVPSSVQVVLGRYGKSLAQDYFQGSLDEVDLYGAPLTASEVMALSHMLLNWKLDSTSGTVAVDSTVAAHDGTLSGGPTWQPTGGHKGGALSFDGSNDTVEVVNAGDFLNGLSEVTISMWIKSNQTNVDKGIFFTDTPVGNDDRFGMRYDKDGASGGGTRLIKASIDTTSGATAIESSSLVQTTNWQHLTLVWRSGESLKLYVDGALDTPVHDLGAKSGTITNVTKFMIGQGAKSAYWNGLMDEIQIFDRALCADEIALLSHGGQLQGIRVLKWVEIK